MIRPLAILLLASCGGAAPGDGDPQSTTGRTKNVATSSISSTSTGVSTGTTTGARTNSAASSGSSSTTSTTTSSSSSGGTTGGGGVPDAGCGLPGVTCGGNQLDPWVCPGTVLCQAPPLECSNGWVPDQAEVPSLQSTCCFPGLVPIANPAQGEPYHGEFICAPPLGGVCYFQDSCASGICNAPAELQGVGVCQ